MGVVIHEDMMELGHSWNIETKERTIEGCIPFQTGGVRSMRISRLLVYWSLPAVLSTISRPRVLLATNYTASLAPY